MSENMDFEADFDNLDDQAQPAANEPAEDIVNGVLASAEANLSDIAGEPVAVEIVDEEEEEVTEDDFFTENAAPATPEMDPAKTVTLKTSTGVKKYVQIDSPISLVDLVGMADIRFNGEYQAWLNGSQIALGDKVAGGMSVNLVGSVKGGARQ